METRFKVAQRVRAAVQTQQVRQDAVYVVVAVHRLLTFFGTFVRYDVREDGAPENSAVTEVTNGHFVLEEVR